MLDSASKTTGTACAPLPLCASEALYLSLNWKESMRWRAAIFQPSTARLKFQRSSSSKFRLRDSANFIEHVPCAITAFRMDLVVLFIYRSLFLRNLLVAAFPTHVVHF